MKRALGLILTIAVVAIAFLSLKGSLPFMPILGASMEPTLHSGSIMVIKPLDNPRNIKVGDIIVFNVQDQVREFYKYPKTVAHRVIKVNTVPNLSFRTQGDNTGEDPFTILPGDIRGTVGKQIPYLGIPMLYFQSTQGMIFVIIAIILLALFLYGREISQGGSWIHRGIFSPIIVEEKKANRMLSKKIETTEQKMDSTEQALRQFSEAVAEYAKHLASHTSAIQGLSEASHELKRGAAEQNRVLSAIMDNVANVNNGASTAPVKTPVPAASKRKPIVIKQPKAGEVKPVVPNYHKALEKGLTSYTGAHSYKPGNSAR